MKKIFSIICLGFLFLTGCQKEVDVFQREFDSLSCDCFEQNISQYLLCSGEWTSESEVDWIRLNPDSGSGNGDEYQQYYVQVAVNQGEEREGTFYLIHNGQRFPVVVRQAKTNFEFGELYLSGLLKQGQPSNAFLAIPYKNATGKETASISCTMTGATQGLTFEGGEFTLAAGNNSIVLPIQGTPESAGTISFSVTLNGKAMGTIESNVKEFTNKRISVWLNGAECGICTESQPGVWELIIDAPATGEITIKNEDVELGFTSYSGAGGLGTCKHMKSALPFYNFTPEHTRFYKVEKAIGALQPISDGGNKLWLNMDAPGKVKVAYDETYKEHGSYYLELVKDDDPTLIFDEQFDLFTYGGDAINYLVGTIYNGTAESFDGLEPGTNNSGKWSSSGSIGQMWDYPTVKVNIRACDDYIKNRGVQDWEFVYVDERPGALQMNNTGQQDNYLITPKFSKISGTQNIVLTLDLARYSSTSKADIPVTIIGAGSFTGGKASQTEGQDTNGVKVEAKSGDLGSLSGSKYSIGTDYLMTAGSSYNASIYKPTSRFEFYISGATAETQIKIAASSASGGNAPRFFIYGIKATLQ
ncbi:MAG: BACON domain-containing protein [Bacteroidales bacterium]|nr:BACON domain-containing protein [Bacteroidales bacterium]